MKRKIEGKYIYRGVCAVILTLVSVAIFYDDWRDFVEINNQTGHLTGLGNLGMAIGIASALVDLQLFFRQNFLLQHAFNQASLSSSRDVAGCRLMKFIGLGHPLKNQVPTNIHGIDRISLKGKGNPID